jgi:NAD(P)-dependent dehydrogenase (short-subunit alcohol dehydrogenase family)
VLCNGAGIYEPVILFCPKPPFPPLAADLDRHHADKLRFRSLVLVQLLDRHRNDQLRDHRHQPLRFNARHPPCDPRPSDTLAPSFLNQPLYGASKAAVSSFTRSLAPLHGLFGIKVVAVAPGMVNTPLWTDYPEKMKAVSWNKQDVVLEPEEVVEAMVRLVEGAQYPGGTVLEVLAEGRTRRVEVDSPVAEGRGATMSLMHMVTEDTVQILRREQAAESDGQ